MEKTGSRMAAAPEDAGSGRWQPVLDRLIEVYEAHGGWLPDSAVAEAAGELGVSPQRVVCRFRAERRRLARASPCVLVDEALERVAAAGDLLDAHRLASVRNCSLLGFLSALERVPRYRLRGLHTRERRAREEQRLGVSASRRCTCCRTVEQLAIPFDK